MDVLDAAYLVGQDFVPGGAEGLARKLRIPPRTFSNELNPHLNFHKLGLKRAEQMTLAAEDYRILHAFAMSANHIAIPKPDLSDVSDVAVLELFLARDKAVGDFAEAVRQALDDGHVSRDDVTSIKQEAYDLAASVLEIVARLEGLCDGR